MVCTTVGDKEGGLNEAPRLVANYWHRMASKTWIAIAKVVSNRIRRIKGRSSCASVRKNRTNLCIDSSLGACSFMGNAPMDRLPQCAACIPVGAVFGRKMPNTTRIARKRQKKQGIARQRKWQSVRQKMPNHRTPGELFVFALLFAGGDTPHEMIRREFTVEQLQHSRELRRVLAGRPVFAVPFESIGEKLRCR